jgi:hypothetical protein
MLAVAVAVIVTMIAIESFHFREARARIRAERA